MKKLIIVALALVAGASLSTIQAGKKNKKAPKSTLQLVSGSDSLSYTAGYVLADGQDELKTGSGTAEVTAEKPEEFRKILENTEEREVITSESNTAGTPA